MSARRSGSLLLGGAAALAAATAVGAVRAQAPPSSRAVVVFSGPAAFGRYSVRVVMDPADARAHERVRAVISGELALAGRTFSRASPSSALSRLNAHGSTAPFAAGPELVEAVFTALRVAEATGGAFDPTAAPLREAWARDGPPPPAKALAALRERVGVGLLSVEPARLAIAKARPDVALDLDDLGGGWLADRIASAIGALGMRHVLVDVGGEVSGRGRRADGSRWHVAAGAEGPRSTDAVVIRLDDSSVATSADDSLPPPDGSESARRRVVDPRTGSPVTHALVSATVVHPDGAWADALAAALLVLGPVEGRALVERRRLAARLVDRLPDGSRSVWSSRSFAALVE